ncbi:hypothetical protein SAMN00808754_0430 [Thermanaeromonas toyohensis ToBE]|uniref:Uncharacterized protein n=2 Tax=Thermanaeromonas TaxID=202949 RepID=A0A1W1VEJ8_9FIRM|nr:hypothetical protein SAMN00808754_0430 [Thermanaeromonas toyohensis ToBE]
MPGELVHPSFLNFIRSLKPYMGRTALQYTELVENLLELLGTEQAKRIQDGFASLREKKTARVSILEPSPDRDVERDPPQGRDPFILFLILILLILSFDK